MLQSADVDPVNAARACKIGMDDIRTDDVIVESHGFMHGRAAAHHRSSDDLPLQATGRVKALLTVGDEVFKNGFKWRANVVPQRRAHHLQVAVRPIMMLVVRFLLCERVDKARHHTVSSMGKLSGTTAPGRLYVVVLHSMNILFALSGRCKV